MNLLKTTVLLLFLGMGVYVSAQTKRQQELINTAIEHNVNLDFNLLAAMFDTTGGKRTPNPFILHMVWNQARELYGQYKSSKIKKAYQRKGHEVIIEELEFDSGYIDIKFVFNNQNKISGYFLDKLTSKKDRLLEEKYRAPSYANTKQVESREVSFGNAPYILQGELTLPKSVKKGTLLPAIILVHGSGPGDRDEKNGPQRPFADIAYGLSTRGIAVLRYDKRTLTYADDCAEDSLFTVNKETVDDAVLAAAFLRTQPGIDPDRVMVLGHSLGGMMLPRIATTDTLLAGCIFMAAPAKSLPDKIIEQMDYLATVEPAKEAEYHRLKEDFVRLKTKWYTRSTKPAYLPFGIGPVYWEDLHYYNQMELVKQLKMPLLFLQGARDYQVTAQDLELWKKALPANAKANFILYNDLNHAMITGTGKATPDEYKIPGNVSLKVIEDIERWVKGLGH